MCTLTLVPLEDGALRVACNRDESRVRPPAAPPRLGESLAGRMIYPVDGLSGGTWIGASDVGLIAALLNRHAPGPAAPPPGARRSRGEIVPRMLAAPSLEQALAFAAEICPVEYPPFRLVLTDGRLWAEVVSDGAAVWPGERGMCDTPQMFASSGLGDALVVGPRRQLFDEFFASAAHSQDRAALQDKFHRHSWPERPHVSVCMRRAAAMTVSCTVVTLTPTELDMSYHNGPPDQPGAPVELCLPRRASTVAGGPSATTGAAMSGAGVLAPSAPVGRTGGRASGTRCGAAPAGASPDKATSCSSSLG